MSGEGFLNIDYGTPFAALGHPASAGESGCAKDDQILLAKSRTRRERVTWQPEAPAASNPEACLAGWISRPLAGTAR